MFGAQARNKVHFIALLAAVVAVMLLLYVGGVAKIIVVAALLAYILDPVVTALEVRGFSRGAATALPMAAIILLAVICWWAVIPVALEQYKEFQSGAVFAPSSRAIAGIESQLREYLSFAGFAEFSFAAELDKMKSSLAQKSAALLFQNSISFFIGLVMIPFVIFFLLKDARQFKRYFIRLVPNRYFEFTLDLMYKMETQLGNYLRGQFLDAFIFGILATFTLWLLDVPYFVFIGIFAGLANLIPFVGPLAGAIAAFLAVVLGQGDMLRGGYVLLAFMLLKTIDDFLIQPFAIGKNVHLHPMVVAIAIIVGGHLFGILGMLLVIPLVGFAKVVLEESINTYKSYRFD
jgi:putative permease